MNHSVICHSIIRHSGIRRVQLGGVCALLLASWTWGANAAPARLSGSYEVIGKSRVGAGMKVSLRFHLKNQGPETLHLQKVTLADFGHRPAGVAGGVAIALQPGSSQEMIQEFVIPRQELEEWQKGVRPRVVLEFGSAQGARVTEEVRLERVTAGKVGEYAGK
jgi:hypothetical protein